MNVLVTGGLGFQGWHLTTALIGLGHMVTALATPSQRSRDRIMAPADDRLRVVWGSVTDPIMVRAALEDQDVVVHMAAMANPEACMERPQDAMAVNVGGTQMVLDALRALGDRSPRLVHVSSCEVYGPVIGDVTRAYQDELAPMCPPTIYAASKCAADRLVYAYVKTFGLHAMIVRPCNIYGPGQAAGAYGGVIPTMVARGLAGQPLQIRGDGSQSREFMHVRDVTSIYVRLVEGNVRPSRHVAVNVGMGDRRSVKGLADALAWRLDVAIEYVPSRPGEVREFNLDTSEAHAMGLLPASPVELSSGLDEYIAWARKA